MSRFFIDETPDENNWVVVKDSQENDEPIAKFRNYGIAENYTKRMNHIDKISCCKSSRTSHGWCHDPDCKNYVMVE